jgi:integrase/recombinase XerC
MRPAYNRIHRADVGDLKTVGGTTYLYLQGKGHDDKDAPVLLISEVNEAIQDYLSSRAAKVTPKSPLFTSTGNRSKPGTFKGYKTDKDGNIIYDKDGNPIKKFYDGRIATTTISTMLKNMLVQAGYDSDRLTAHSLRHTSGTGAHKAGIDLYGVQHLMRHCDPATSEIYIHDDDHKAAEEKGRKGIYDYYFNDTELTPVMPELEAEIMTLTLEQQQALLAQIRAQKGGK